MILLYLHIILSSFFSDTPEKKIITQNDYCIESNNCLEHHNAFLATINHCHNFIILSLKEGPGRQLTGGNVDPFLWKNILRFNLHWNSEYNRSPLTKAELIIQYRKLRI